MIAGIFLILSLFIISLAYADRVGSNPLVGNVLSGNLGNSGDSNPGNSNIAAGNIAGNQEGNPYASLNVTEIRKEKNKVKFTANSLECAENCTCTGSVVRCEFENGTRVMTVHAGNSGNVIVQVSGENMTTNVTLYKSGNRVYGAFAGNKTGEIRMFPDQIKERIREKTNANITNENITLDENGTYQYEAEKNSRLFGLIPVKEKIMAKIDSANGTLINLNSPWWSFLASDVQSASLIGASCGTVTPGQNNQCCITRGYDLWNAASNECGFNLSQ